MFIDKHHINRPGFIVIMRVKVSSDIPTPRDFTHINLNNIAIIILLNITVQRLKTDNGSRIG